MGIIFATLILTISSVIHNNNLSEEQIIKEAQKLGMVMPDETESDQGGLWNKNEDVDATEGVETTESADATDNEDVSTQWTEVESSALQEQTEIEEQTSEEQTRNDGEQVKGDNNITYIIINVYPGDAARQVAERLHENKLVDDAESFRKYLGQTGQANRLHVGEFMVPVGATYEQIIDILMGR